MNDLDKMNLIAIVQQLPKDDIDFIQTYISIMEEKIERLNNIINELEKLCNEEIKNGLKTDFGKETTGISFKQTLTSYEFILDKLKELKENKQ